MGEKESDSGFSANMVGKPVSFRADVEIIKDRDGNQININIPKGAVGTLTGGFSTKGEKGKVKTLYDVDVCLHRGNCKRVMLMISVPTEVLDRKAIEDLN